MKIVLIEPFYSGSHKSWADELKNNSSHEIIIISLPGVFWKWRMHGGAITLAKEFNEQFKNNKPNLILATDMLNLPVFLSLTKSITFDIPIILYFHENQLTYPWSTKDTDIIKKRDHHYGFINYSSALSSDIILFNSYFHKNTFIKALHAFLKQFPDHNEINTIKMIKSKSEVSYIGIKLKYFDKFKIQYKKPSTPIILWNHRWEYDKNPILFFETLLQIKKLNYKFNLIVLGQEFDTEMEIFSFARKHFSDEIIHFGYCDSENEYIKFLWMADIIPVTSKQEFFGISVMQAVYCNTYPLLPNNLTYPELFNSKKNIEVFYDDETEFKEKLISLIKEPQLCETNKFREIASNYDWTNMISLYDNYFETININKDS